ncbi:MAG: 2-amino-4-oxopentanoate thiolase subunit OrtA [Candidatus Izemoplasma sp.]
MIKKNTFVRIRKTILQPDERSSSLPNDTKEVPFKMWIKGYLQEDSYLFDIVTIKTETGRFETGRLKESEPYYKHNYGEFIKEIKEIDHIIKSEMYGDIYE